MAEDWRACQLRVEAPQHQDNRASALRDDLSRRLATSVVMRLKRVKVTTLWVLRLNHGDRTHDRNARS